MSFKNIAIYLYWQHVVLVTVEKKLLSIYLNKVTSLDIKYGEIHIKQYHTVIYLGLVAYWMRHFLGSHGFKSYKQN